MARTTLYMCTLVDDEIKTSNLMEKYLDEHHPRLCGCTYVISIDTAIHHTMNIHSPALWNHLLDYANAGRLIALLLGPPVREVVSSEVPLAARRRTPRASTIEDCRRIVGPAAPHSVGTFAAQCGKLPTFERHLAFGRGDLSLWLCCA